MKNCHICVESGTTLKHKRHQQRFTAPQTLKFDTEDILDPLLKTRIGNQRVVTSTGRHSKLTRAIPIYRTTTIAVMCLLFDAWLVPNGIPSQVLTEHNTQFFGIFFGTLRSYLDAKHISTTVGHTQTKGQGDGYNKTIVNPVSHYPAPINAHKIVLNKP